jgi:hypothetical protein
MARDPADRFRDELRKFMDDLSLFGTRISVLEERVKLLLYILGVVAVGTIGAIIAALVTLLKGHP